MPGRGTLGPVPVFMLLVFVVSTTAGGQEVEWNRQFGSPAFDRAARVHADGSGVYAVGHTDGELPGQRGLGDSDAVVRKYDTAGVEAWTRQFGTAGVDRARGVSGHASGIYVAGHAAGALPGQVHEGEADAFVRKYDFQGNEIWTRQFGSSADDLALDVAADASGVYVAGFTGGALPGQVNAGGADSFLRKYDHEGTEVWTRQFGAAVGDAALGVSAGAGGAYVAGFVREGSFPGQVSAGGEDAYVTRFNPAGNQIWMHQFGSSEDDRATGVSAGAAGVYLAGETVGALPGEASAGGTDAFVRKYGFGGNEAWTRQFGTAATDIARDIVAHGTGIFTTGDTAGTLPGQTSQGATDGFVRRYSADGMEIWTLQFGSPGIDRPLGVTADFTAVYAAGLTEGTLPGEVSVGGTDAFVAKMAPVESTVCQRASAVLEILGSLSREDVTTEGHRRALLQFIKQACRFAEAGEVTAARRKLEQAQSRVDGCALRGEPDTGRSPRSRGPARDYVLDCSVQAQIYLLLQEAFEALD